jgi:hypothetical protein
MDSFSGAEIANVVNGAALQAGVYTRPLFSST